MMINGLISKLKSKQDNLLALQGEIEQLDLSNKLDEIAHVIKLGKHGLSEQHQLINIAKIIGYEEN